MYKIEIAKTVFKDLAKISLEICDYIRIKIHSDLAANPKGSECKILQGKKYSSYSRYRVRDYRVLYQIIESEKIILIARIRSLIDLY